MSSLKTLLFLVSLFTVTTVLAQEPFNPTSRESLRLGVPDPAVIEARDGSGYYIFATGHGVGGRITAAVNGEATNRTTSSMICCWTSLLSVGQRSMRNCSRSSSPLSR